MPFTLNTGISIQPGFETYVGIDRQFTNKLSSPYSKCLSDLVPPNAYAVQLFSFFNQLNVTYYDQNFCYKLCYQDKLINNCSCCDIVTPSIRNSTFCMTSSEIECLNSFNEFFSTTDLNSLCDNACPQQCNMAEFKLALSMASFPTLNYLKIQQTSSNKGYMFPQNVTNAELQSFASKGFLKLIINYNNLYYTSIDESPATSFDMFFGNIGGQLGLFLGISLLSFVELLELIVQFVILLIEHRKQKIVKISEALNISAKENITN